MLTRGIIFILPFIILDISVLARDYEVKISSNDPIVQGGTIYFTAIFLKENVISNYTRFKFFWQDNGIPKHTRESAVGNATDFWAVTYDADVYVEGLYIMNVVVKACPVIECYEIDSARVYFKIKAPISNVTITGDRMVQKGNPVILEIECEAEGNVEYCALFKWGTYNVTGKETCFIFTSVDKCLFGIEYNLYLPEYTLLIIIRDDVSQIVKSASIFIYEASSTTTSNSNITPPLEEDVADFVICGTYESMSISFSEMVFMVFIICVLSLGTIYYLRRRARSVETADKVVAKVKPLL